MVEVFLLQHVHLFEHGTEDVKVIGIYRSQEEAEAAIERLLVLPGFRDAPDTFCIRSYELGTDHWTEGYGAIWPDNHRQTSVDRVRAPGLRLILGRQSG